LRVLITREEDDLEMILNSAQVEDGMRMLCSIAFEDTYSKQLIIVLSKESGDMMYTVSRMPEKVINQSLTSPRTPRAFLKMESLSQYLCS